MDHSIYCAEVLETRRYSVATDTLLNEFVSELRQRFLETYEKYPEDYDQRDVKNIETNDFQIKRFLTNNNLNTNEAFNQLIEAMKWRKSFGVKRDYSQTAVEVFYCGAVFIYGKDKEERPILYVRAKTHVKIPKLEQIVQDMIVTTLEQLDQKSEGNGFTVVMDMSGAGIANADLSVAKFMISVMRNYFPGSLKSFIIVNLPTILKTLMPIVRLLLGSKASQILHIVSGHHILQFIDPEWVPKYLGGTSTYDFTIPPEECTKTAEELAKNVDMSPRSVRKAMKKFEPHMIEAKALVNKCENLKE